MRRTTADLIAPSCWRTSHASFRAYLRRSRAAAAGVGALAIAFAAYGVYAGYAVGAVRRRSRAEETRMCVFSWAL